MQRIGETYVEYQKRVLCENASRLGIPIFSPSCESGKKEYEVVVYYNEAERDILHLCRECRNRIKRDARRHGYKVRTAKL